MVGRQISERQLVLTGDRGGDPGNEGPMVRFCQFDQFGEIFLSQPIYDFARKLPVELDVEEPASAGDDRTLEGDVFLGDFD